MTARTKPDAATPSIKKPAAGQRAAKPAPVTLTKDEAEWLRCYQVMSLRSRSECLNLAQAIAAEFPMVKPASATVSRPALRLVTREWE